MRTTPAAGLAMGALLLLGGCNMVTTSTPLFSAADQAGAPQMRPGLWASPDDASCKFDDQAALASWPNCAHGVIVSAAAVGEYKDDSGKPTLTETAYILVAGDPLVIQIHEVEPAAGSGMSVSGYLYGGLRATKTDDQGRITAYAAWPVLCGPPPPDNTTGAGGKMVFGTRKPLPGMVMDKDGDDCTTTSPDAVRDAAKLSAQWSSGGASAAHWVRDGDR